MKKECLQCQKPFKAIRLSRKYCSDTCKYNAFLQRHGYDPLAKDTVNNVKVNVSNSTVNVINDKTGKKSQSYDEIYSPMLDTISKYLNEEDGFNEQEWNNNYTDTILWVNIRLKCLLNQLLRLCYLRSVTYGTLETLYNAFNSIATSDIIKKLPENAPHIAYIHELLEKLNILLHKTTQQGSIKLFIALPTKAKMIAVMSRIGQDIPFKKFSQLQF